MGSFSYPSATNVLGLTVALMLRTCCVCRHQRLSTVVVSLWDCDVMYCG